MTAHTKNIRVENFGCRLNALEGDAITTTLSATLSTVRSATRPTAQQAQDSPAQAMTIINGCAVTHEALRQARQAARKAKRNTPEARIVVTGCAAQIDAAQFAAMPEVDLVLGNVEKLNPASYAPTMRGVYVSDIMTPKITGQITEQTAPPPPITQNTRSRAFVQVQTGCDHRCTFCIIPFGRGNSRSLAVPHILHQCAALYAQGHKEIVLTGVDITSYRTADADNLGTLVKMILHHLPQLPRLRLSSVDAVELDTTLTDLLINEPRLMPYLHLSLQSGDDLILKRMKRRHSRAQAIELCTYLRAHRPAMSFGADLIAGFPTESEAALQNSLTLIDECGLAHCHIFPFSPRPNTPAARMPQIDPQEIKARAARLRAHAHTATQHWRSCQIGQTHCVLMEDAHSGRSENFARVKCDYPHKSPHKRGDIVPMRITGYDETQLISTMIDTGTDKRADAL